MNEDCSVCDVPLATGHCTHVILTEGQVTMSRQTWYALIDKLNALEFGGCCGPHS